MPRDSGGPNTGPVVTIDQTTAGFPCYLSLGIHLREREPKFRHYRG